MNNIVGIITERKHLQGVLHGSTVNVYPELEDLEITPSGVEQNFKSEKYGYNNVKVNAVISDTLNVIPIEENQQIVGLFGIVNVEKIPEKYVIPEVKENILMLSKGNIEGGVLTI